LPNKLIGVVGEHAFPIESIKLSRDGKYLGSCSHDNTVKFWCMEGVLDKTEGEDDGGKESDSDSDNDNENENEIDENKIENGKEEVESRQKSTMEIEKPSRMRANKKDFFKDL
jgi:WD40 repeat protein